jgi:hypothetical protein
MARIHHVEQHYEDRFVLDPQLGPVKRRELVMKPSTVESIVAKGEEYRRLDDLTFEVPEDVRVEFCGDGRHRMGRPGWAEGANPFATEAEEKAAPKAPRTRPAASK